MSKRLPYFQFEPAEWLSGDIMICSLEAQGLFTNLMCLYWQKECELTLDQAIRRFKNSEIFDELISEKVIKISHGKIKISFLEKQHEKASEKSRINAENGAKGGRGKKRNESEIKPNAFDSQNENESEEKPLREDKIKEEENKVDTVEIKKEGKEKKQENVSAFSTPTSPAEKKEIDFKKFMDFFNQNRGNMPAVQIMSDSRKTRVKNLFNKFGREKIIEVIMKAKESDFIQGNNGREWKANFDWITAPKNFVKILENNYANGKPTFAASGSATHTAASPGYKPASIDPSKLAAELAADFENGNIPGKY